MIILVHNNVKSTEHHLLLEDIHIINSGLEYTTKTNRIVERKKVELSCPDSCKLKCKEKILADTRHIINSKFWSGQKSIDMKRQFEKLCEGSNAPFAMNKKTEESEDFLISKIVHFQVRQDSPGVDFFETAFDDNHFQKLDVTRRTRRNAPTTVPENLHQIRHSARPISTKKYNHLQKLLPWVPKIFHNFYINITHGDGGEDSD